MKFETLFVENKFQGSKTCKKIRARFKSRFIHTRSQGESWAHRRRITIKDRDKNHRLDLQLKVQEILGLTLDSTFYNSKCWIKEIQNNKGLAKLNQWFVYISTHNLHINKNVDLMWEDFTKFYAFIN